MSPSCDLPESRWLSFVCSASSFSCFAYMTSTCAIKCKSGSMRGAPRTRILPCFDKFPPFWCVVFDTSPTCSYAVPDATRQPRLSIPQHRPVHPDLNEMAMKKAARSIPTPPKNPHPQSQQHHTYRYKRHDNRQPCRHNVYDYWQSNEQRQRKVNALAQSKRITTPQRSSPPEGA